MTIVLLALALAFCLGLGHTIGRHRERTESLARQAAEFDRGKTHGRDHERKVIDDQERALEQARGHTIVDYLQRTRPTSMRMSPGVMLAVHRYLQGEGAIEVGQEMPDRLFDALVGVDPDLPDHLAVVAIDVVEQRLSPIANWVSVEGTPQPDPFLYAALRDRPFFRSEYEQTPPPPTRCDATPDAAFRDLLFTSDTDLRCVQPQGHLGKHTLADATEFDVQPSVSEALGRRRMVGLLDDLGIEGPPGLRTHTLTEDEMPAMVHETVDGQPIDPAKLERMRQVLGDDESHVTRLPLTDLTERLHTEPLAVYSDKGWLRADGRILAREDYPDLFDAIGTTYDTDPERANASDTFMLPSTVGRRRLTPGLPLPSLDTEAVIGQVLVDVQGLTTCGLVPPTALVQFGGPAGPCDLPAGHDGPHNPTDAPPVEANDSPEPQEAEPIDEDAKWYIVDREGFYLDGPFDSAPEELLDDQYAIELWGRPPSRIDTTALAPAEPETATPNISATSFPNHRDEGWSGP